MTELRASYRVDYPAALMQQMEMVGITGFVQEYMFHPTRRWRFDIASEELMIAVEVDGAVWTQGRHTRGAGYIEDCRKMAEAACLGWLVLRCPSDWVQTGEALRYVECAIKSRQGEL